MSLEDIDKLAEILRSTVDTAITKGLTPTESEHAVIWWEPYDETGSTGRTEIRKATDIRSVARMLYAEPSMAQLRAIASDIRKIKWPEFLIDETAEIICDCYFSAVGSVAIDETTLREVAEKYVTEVQDDEFDYATVFQVSQFSAAKAFELNDNIHFRPITDADIEHFGYEPLPVRRSPRLNKRDWICTVTQTYRSDDVTASYSSRDGWDILIGSLGLSNEGDAWFSLLSAGPTSPFLRGSQNGNEHRLHSSPHGNAVRLDPEDVDRFRDAFALTSAICARNSKNLVPAFRRFRAAAGREIMEDKLTDLVIALESLLAPDSSTGEIGYKFRMRGAALLPDSFGVAVYSTRADADREPNGP